MTQDSLHFVLHRLLWLTGIKHDKDELFFQIKSHPSYPSLHAVTGVLDHFDIENMAVEVPVNTDALTQLPSVFLAQLKDEKGHRFAVIRRKKQKFQLLLSASEVNVVDSETLLERFTGVIVAVEKEADSEALKDQRYLNPVLWTAIGLLAVGLLFRIETPIPALAFLALSVIGLAISLAILKQESGLQTSLGNTLCADATEKKDCDAILNSKGAKVLGRYKFSDLSLLYFATLFLGSFLITLQNGRMEVLYFTAALALPVTVYSIYYQWRVVKKWCLLCLSIVAVLWTQAGISLLLSDLAIPLVSNELLLLGLTALVVFSAWYRLKPMINQLTEGEKTKLAYYKLKRNFKLFLASLNSSDPISTSIPGNGEIFFGNEKALNQIIIVTNPFCSHCKPVHLLVEKVLSQYTSEIGLTIRFNINMMDESSDLVKITTRLLEIYTEEGNDRCMKAMGEIYGDSAAREWFLKWGESSDPKKFLSVLRKGKAWCKEKQINFTPEILINGRSFPRAYERTDLLYFIEDLHERALETQHKVSEKPLEMAF